LSIVAASVSNISMRVLSRNSRDVSLFQDRTTVGVCSHVLHRAATSRAYCAENFSLLPLRSIRFASSGPADWLRSFGIWSALDR
jgi:hypothetical protein